MQNLFISFFEFVRNFTKGHEWKIYGIFLAIFIASLFTVIDPFLLKILIDKVTNTKNELNIFSERSYGLIIFLFIISNLCSNLIWRVINYISLKTFPSVRTKIFLEAFKHLASHSSQYLQDNLTGDLANKIQDIGESIENIFESIFSVMYIIFTILITIIVAYIINPYFSLALISWLIFFIWVSLLFSKTIIKYSREFAEIRSVLNGKYVDNLINIFSIKLFVAQRFEEEYLKNISLKVVEKDIGLRFRLLKLWTIQGILCSLILGIMVLILIFLHINDVVNAGDFVFIISITITVIHQIFGVSESISRILDQIGICNQAVSVIYAPHTIVNIEDANTLAIKKAEISFKDVSFWYNENNKLFENLNITISSNQKIGLVGYSGGGKTSLVNLLMRLYDVQKGDIRIDQQSIKSVTIESLRKNIAFVPQNPILFHRSFIDNIRYGRLDATDSEVIEAAKKAYAHEFILSTHDGYNSLLGENGVKVSGGQRQIIAIARAILKNSPILILDEATSNLDSLTEELIQQSLREMMHNKTVITIAHRLSTLLIMDRILVFDKGKIVEEGGHEELLSMKGLYSKLWNSQVGGYLRDAF